MFHNILVRFGLIDNNISLGDKVFSTENKWGQSHHCVVTRIYNRKRSGGYKKYCQLEFTLWGKKKLVNVPYKSCQRLSN